jgi:surface polysaccharide O-acyltransferase-like enzyme
MDEQAFQRDLASYQQEQDFLKHLVTLSTGCIVLMVTFLEKLFRQPRWKFLVVASLLSFGVSITASLTLHFLSVLNIDSSDTKALNKSVVVIGILMAILSFGGFLAGLTTLVVFGVKNLYS